MTERPRLTPFALLCLLLPLCLPARAQDNYEIQVYGSETVPAGYTMVELHSNFTINGSKTPQDGVLPTQHAFHETVEITHGFTPWFETGFYLFTSIQPHEGWEWVGNHIRPRVRAPEEWHLPVGLSLSAEAGYQQRKFSTDIWTLELRPIIDKQIGRWYGALNPVFDKSFSGANSSKGWGFAPNAKVSYDVTKVVTLGVEYYGSVGSVMHFDTLGEQEHMIVPALDLNFSPKSLSE